MCGSRKGRDDMVIVHGETIEGAFYVEFEKDQMDDIELYDPYISMLLSFDDWMKMIDKPSYSFFLRTLPPWVHTLS